MNRLHCILLLITGFSLKLSAQENVLTKEKFREKIIGSFDTIVKVDLLDSSIFHIDSAYHLPRPIYKARVIKGAESDSLFFYYYHNLYQDSVLYYIVFSTWNADSLRYMWAEPFSDSTLKSSVVFFYPNHYDSLKIVELNYSISASFDYTQDTITFGNVTLEEVIQEEARVEPPPPPPPKPPKRKRRNRD